MAAKKFTTPKNRPQFDPRELKSHLEIQRETLYQVRAIASLMLSSLDEDDHTRYTALNMAIDLLDESTHQLDPGIVAPLIQGTQAREVSRV